MNIPPEILGMGMEEDVARVWCNFAPFHVQRMAGVIANKTRFVHYTSAEVGMSILTDKSVWMRSAATMNDFSEIEYGTQLLLEVWGSEVGKRLRAAISAVFPDAADKATQLYDGWSNDFRHNTYITSLSEHYDFEDDTGRLSMWRAYGGVAGVALVMNQQAMTSASDALQAYTAPVGYFDSAKVHLLFEQVAINIENDADFLRQAGEDTIVASLFSLFQSTVIATKHPGFGEEAEWRVTHSPSMNPSERIKPYIRTVRGAPQTIYKIPLENVPDEGLVGLDIPELINRIIIGPTDHSYTIAEAYVRQLTSLGVKDAWERVHISKIPLRNG